MWKFGTLTASPFNWLEASYFYYRPSDLIWLTDGVAGHYLDKGFNVKLIYRPKNINSKIAIGLDDFAGTGLFTKEYIISTTQINNIRFTLGLGWGKFTGERSFKNPLIEFSDALEFRPSISDNYNVGGSLSYDMWFRGESAFFGGIEYKVPLIKGLNLKIENDPFDYFDYSANNAPGTSFKKRNKDSNINYGLSYKINDYFSIDLSSIKGNTANLTLNFSINFGKEIFQKPKFEPKFTKANPDKKSKRDFYEDLLINLNNNQLLLQTADLDDNKLDISISTSQHRNAIRSSSYSAHIANEISKLNDINLSQINVTNINVGIELNNISYIPKHIEKNNRAPIEVKKYYTNFQSGKPLSYKYHEFKPKVNFPAIFSSLSPNLISHIGVPEKFYSGTLALQHSTEIQFSRRLLLTSELNYSLYTTIQDTISGSGSLMEHVRTDLVQYLKEDDFFLTRLQLDYVWSPKKDFYAKISGGIFETMFGGIGGEVLFKPFNSKLTIGAEIFAVKQRAYDQMFDFRDYETTTGHINFGYYLPLGLEANISFGRYLAKDDGYTFDLSKRTRSGFKAGIYFTRTDVSAELFGEGSFDKGFYFQIPIDLLSRNYSGNYSTFKLSPLTRDGGAKLMHDKNLKGLIYNSSRYELERQWNGFLN